MIPEYAFSIVLGAVVTGMGAGVRTLIKHTTEIEAIKVRAEERHAEIKEDLNEIKAALIRLQGGRRG